MNYPKYKYHAELDPTIVNSEEEESSLGEGWADSPADHGVITNPSAEQARQIQIDELKKSKDLADDVEGAVNKKRGKK